MWQSSSSSYQTATSGGAFRAKHIHPPQIHRSVVSGGICLQASWGLDAQETCHGRQEEAWRKKRKYELGRQPANTKLSSNKTVRRVRVRGGNVKWRALRVDTGNYSWGTEAVTRKTRVLDVVYNASNNELVRTQTLVKSAIVQVDAAPFKQWYLQHYGVEIGRKKKAATKKETSEEGEAATDETKKSNHVLRKLEKRREGHQLEPHIEEQFAGGRLLACISSRPGQCGRADGYILEGKELEFYMKKLQRKKGKGAGAA
ncbi:Small ribosomal subunit protein eS8-like protein [Drosera capensis]